MLFKNKYCLMFFVILARKSSMGMMRAGFLKYFVTIVFLMVLGGVGMAFEIESPAFNADETIPAKYTCSGEDISPALRWRDIPDGAVSLAVVCDDPDAPGGSWVHWVIYNIAARLGGLDEAVFQKEQLGDGVFQGVNDFHRFGYNGPCPPPGRPHRYVFTVYALDTFLQCRGEVNKQTLLQAMKGHILGQVSLIGKYGR